MSFKPEKSFLIIFLILFDRKKRFKRKITKSPNKIKIILEVHKKTKKNQDQKFPDSKFPNFLSIVKVMGTGRI